MTHRIYTSEFKDEAVNAKLPPRLKGRMTKYLT